MKEAEFNDRRLLMQQLVLTVSCSDEAKQTHLDWRVEANRLSSLFKCHLSRTVKAV